MQIVLLDEARFDSFALNHPNQNYYQSSQYGRFVSKHGYNSYYLGMIDNTNEIKAATLIIVKNDIELQDSDIITTNTTVKVGDYKTYKVIVSGDITGTGTITSTDISQLKHSQPSNI